MWWAVCVMCILQQWEFCHPYQALQSCPGCQPCPQCQVFLVKMPSAFKAWVMEKYSVFSFNSSPQTHSKPSWPNSNKPSSTSKPSLWYCSLYWNNNSKFKIKILIYWSSCFFKLFNKVNISHFSLAWNTKITQTK